MLYRAISDTMISVALVSEDEGETSTCQNTQYPIYYLSRALKGEKIRCLPIEKLALAVIVTTHRLHPYFQAHAITIPMSYLVLQVLRKPNISGCLTKWVIELSEFNVRFTPIKAIKGQTLAKFVTELTRRPESNPEETWTMHVDK